MSEARKLVSNPPGVAKPIRGYYSNSVRVSAGPLLFIAGQVALDSEGRVVGKGDVRAQTVQVPEKLPKQQACGRFAIG
jgi:2-iminobutanoate/2-iminopropanoate deaminase